MTLQTALAKLDRVEPVQLIRIDWIGAAVAGLLVLLFSNWVADLYSLPITLVRALAWVNLAYSSFSFTLAMASREGRVPLLRVVAVANLVWTLCCFVLAARWLGEASVFGLAHLVGEGIFVGALGVLEWRASADSLSRR